MDRLSTLGVSLCVIAPCRSSFSDLVKSEVHRSSSCMWQVHILQTTFGSLMDSTVRGGPGTSNFLLVEASKRLRTSSLGATDVASILSSSCKHLVKRSMTTLFWLGPSFNPTKASIYFSMKSSRQAMRSPFSARSLPLSLLIRSDTWRGSLLNTHACRSAPNIVGTKSSSSKTPAAVTASCARWHAMRKASTNAANAGIGARSGFGSCK
mmetsp:Transcript_27956/g.65050  ORF Transcript_27956/g.65050 Transcript_27956/m.65050 type:complete len:209 (-) Transcript_27956:579-1205(-)